MDYVFTDRPIELAADHVADVLKKHLSRGERVLWLMTGGSGIAISVLASKKLVDTDLSNLYISLTDERFGPVGHKDENWQQLLNNEFTLMGGNLYRPLNGNDIANTASNFADWLDEQFKNADYSLGLFGIGTDGHTAGIKPHSQVATTNELVVSYHGEDFDRVTISFNSIRKISEAVIQISGNDKRVVTHQLIYEDIPLDTQPAQILKEIPIATIYSNNDKGE